MKKALSVLIILTFLSSTVFMAGCGGGGGGIGAIVAAAFVISIVASGGTAAAPVFAANMRAAAISANAGTLKVIVTPIAKDGTTAGTATTIDIKGSDFDATNNTIKTSLSVSQVDGYNQYKVEVKDGNTLLLSGMEYFRNSEKAGTQNMSLNATSTAKMMAYEKWIQTAPTKTYETFEANINTVAANGDINTIATNVHNQLVTLSTNGTSPDYSTVAVNIPNVTNTNTANYTIKGFVTAADMVSGSTGTLINVTRKSDGAAITHTGTAEGNYTIEGLEDGVVYTLTPVNQGHTFTPATLDVTINGENVTGQNFQAAQIR